MIVPLFFVAFIIWVLFQSRESRAKVWAHRKEAFMTHPITVEFGRDVQATYYYARDWPTRFGDRRRMKKLLRTFELSED